MIEIIIPNNFLPERSYTIDIIINELLGLPYRIKVDQENKNYQILLPNANKIIIKDHFFGQFESGTNYLDLKYIPNSISFEKNRYCPEANIPIIYGTGEFIRKNDDLLCGIDIFASAFFMLTRWEEYVKLKRDNHNRFPAYESLAYKNNFLHRPIVNEYVEMLWNLLLSQGCTLSRKNKEFEMVLTHDVDHLRNISSLHQLLKKIKMNIIKEKSLKDTFSTLNDFLNINMKIKVDPYDTFDWLMDLSERYHTKSRFYLMGGGMSIYDDNYKINDIKVRKLVDQIKRREHLIGFHPSYDAYDNRISWQQEKKSLEKITNIKIREGRGHYLRFKVPDTWILWDENNMELDSTMGYPEKEGFRCGTGDIFTVFDIIHRKKLKLKERPIIFMDATHLGYSDETGKEKSMNMLINLINIAKKYKSSMTVLFHNSIFINEYPVNFKKLYLDMLKYAL